ncbi:MAG: TorF family putative porin [Sphingobium sp.]
MRKSILGLTALAIAALATPAMAQDEADTSGIKITGSAGIVSDYRFRGFSQTRENAAVQGGFTLTHESGFYVGTWGSNVDFPDLDGEGNGVTAELDFFGGFSKEVTPGLTVDAGLLYYYYPKDTVGDVDTDFFEPYINLIAAVGPGSLKAGVNYAWDQNALGDSSAIYFHLEPSVAIPNTPIGVNAHLGYAKSDAFPGGVDGKVWDWSIGGTLTYKNLTFGVSYVDTDEPGNPFGSDSAAVFSLGAAF